MHRRSFLRMAAVTAAGLGVGAHTQPSSQRIPTVTKAIPPGQLGVTLIHEHLLVDFIGAAGIHAGRYDAQEVFQVALPHLQRLRALGCRTFVDATPAYLGRDVKLLQRLARASRLHIITNTGYYGAGKGKYVPDHARELTAEKLAAVWLEEYRYGIERTNIKPGFMKIGVNQGPLSPLDAKLVRAAAFAHKQSGLTIASHTGDGAAAMEELDILEREGVSPAAFIWVHAQSEKTPGYHLRAAQRSAWVAFDGISEKSHEWHLQCVRAMAGAGYLGRTLISQDAGWYHVGEPGGGRFRPFDYLFTAFVPALEKTLGKEATRLLLKENPARALAAKRG